MTGTAVQVLPDGRPIGPPTGDDPKLQVMTPAVFGLDLESMEKALKTLEDPRWLTLQKRFAMAYDNACAALLGSNDVQKEGKGVNAREFKKKSAWRKLAKHFGVTTRVVGNPSWESVEGGWVVRVTVEGRSSWGHSTEAIGACSSDQESGRRQITLADGIATAETRATNRAISNLIAMGEVSYEEVAKNEVAQGAPEEITLEQAKEWPFPWKTPARYAGKPMGTLSENMLRRVRVAVVNELKMNPGKVSLLELKQVCTLLIDEIEEKEAQDNAEPHTIGQDGVPVHEGGYPAEDVAPREEAAVAREREPGEEDEIEQDERRLAQVAEEEEQQSLVSTPKKKPSTRIRD